jgi:hypothetical protein
LDEAVKNQGCSSAAWQKAKNDLLRCIKYGPLDDIYHVQQHLAQHAAEYGTPSMANLVADVKTVGLSRIVKANKRGEYPVADGIDMDSLQRWCQDKEKDELDFVSLSDADNHSFLQRLSSNNKASLQELHGKRTLTEDPVQNSLLSGAILLTGQSGLIAT